MAVIGVLGLASVRSLAGGGARPAHATALSPLGCSARPGAGASACAGTTTSAGAAAAGSALADVDRAGAAAAPAFDGHDLVVQGAELHAGLGPRIEMVFDSHGTTGSRTLADGDVLLEGCGTLDRWLIDLLVLPDLV